MNFNEWLIDKVEGVNLPFMALQMDIEFQKLINIIEGKALPDCRFLAKLIWFFELDNEEQLKLFAAAGETLGISANQVFQGVVDEIMLLAKESETQKR